MTQNKAKKVHAGRLKVSLAIEILCTLGIAFAVVLSSWAGLYQDAMQRAAEVAADYSATLDNYVSVFNTMLIPIKEKLAENPTFDEMQAWMLTKEADFKAALGDDTYDGIALTYKGGYAHSWDYGDYTNYVAAERPWYQAAQQANGEVAIVPPYVTFLDSSYFADGVAISMTIAQKYTDDISFDLDLKIAGIQNLLTDKTVLYSGEQIYLYNSNGYILSSTRPDAYAHNFYTPDDVITQGMSNVVAANDTSRDVLLLDVIDDSIQYMLFHADTNGNIVCVTVPFWAVFMRHFSAIFIIALFLIAFEIYLYIRNKRTAVEFAERDRRLDVVADTIYAERLEVDVEKMVFFGNDTAGKICPDGTYDELFALMTSRLANKEDVPRLEAFLSPKVILDAKNDQYAIRGERFLMNMRDADGSMREKTIEVNRLGFTRERRYMLAIALRDASESADLLKAALKETQAAKEETAREYMRFMSYICTAVDAVTELDIKNRRMTRYTVKDGVLNVEHEAYLKDEWVMFHPDDREKITEEYSLANLKRLCTENKTAYSECRMRWGGQPDYHWCTTILQGIPPTDEKPFNLLLLIKDTNELKTREQAQRKALEDAFAMAKQASEAKGTFLSKMSHEIRTPLNAIIGYLSIAKDSYGDTAKVQHCIDNGEIAAKHLLQIINDVLDMSSIESGRMKIASEDFDLKKEVADITTIFYQTARQKGVRFESQIDGLSDEWVVGDKLRLNQVLMNLLSNAVKFTHENGTVKLKIQQLNPEAGKNEVYLQFTVSDTGIGMSEEYMQRLFTPFEQESATTAQKYGGSGLGLSITKNLVTMMGGSITAQSKQGEGTTFAVTMHFGKSQTHHAVVNTTGDYSHVRALIVDDEPDDGVYIKSMLKRCGVKADSVTSGKDALRRIKSRMGGDFKYDLCILDWNMPDMNGVETAQRIRELLGDTMPLIIATAYDISEFASEAKSVGVNKIVAKPLFQSTLFDLLVSTFGEYDPTASEEKAADVNMTGMHLILAEDNEMNMEIAVTVLEKAGIKVDKAVNGQEAVDMFEKSAPGTYNLILMDVQMPVLNGYEATRAIRASAHPEAKIIPIIAMTANAFAEDVAEALSNGMNAHIAKPISRDKLFDVLKKFS